jgi:two-component system sensor histidine kinase MprB
VSLRTRIAAAAGLAVALAVLAAAIGLYIAVRSDLRGQIDESLTQRSQEFVSGLLLSGAAGAGAPGAEGFSRGSAPLAPGDRTSTRGPLPRAVQPARFGGASGYVQFVSAAGTVAAPRGQGSTPEIPPDSGDRAIAARGSGRTLSDRTVKGTRLRVLTLGTPETAGASGRAGSTRGAVMIARPLTETDHELSRILLILLVVGIAGIAFAAMLGALVARTALAPIVRFTRRTESLAGELNLSERLQVSGGDELELQHDARRAAGRAVGSAPADRRRQPRAAHADLLAAREHPDAPGSRSPAAGRAAASARGHHRGAR